MATVALVNKIRNIIYGKGLGESAPIRRAAADASSNDASPVVTFTLASGENANVKPGHTLSVMGAAAQANAHVVKVLTVATTDVVTAVTAYLGSPAVSGTDVLDNALLEQNAMVTEFEMWKAATTIIESMLWPNVWKVKTEEVATPDIVDGQEAVPADVEEILHAWQMIGPTAYSIGVQRKPLNVSTDIASTGKLVRFEWANARTGYYTYRTKLVAADITDRYEHMVAVGAAALCLGASITETSMERTKKDSAEAVDKRGQVANSLWRDFVTLRQQIQEELWRALPSQIFVDRG